ncbi:MAG: hypothetical protein JW958_03055 [Candidatus Eisenbacteria bacterium]|nr:hypothetical protein [Candidatus Eisenbacteria bacterium]
MSPLASITAFVRRAPLRTAAWLAASWIALAALYQVLERMGFHEEMPRLFPISIFSGPALHPAGVPWILLFAATLFFATARAERLRPRGVFAAAFLLVLFGNLGQGGWKAGFEEPFTAGDIRYYHDAVKIRDAGAWLGAFNEIQPDLLVHSRTHPPFAVLLHYGILRTGGGAAALGISFTLLALLALPVTGAILRELGVPRERRGPLLILFAVLPAVNIYSAASLDGVILLPATLFLYGLVLIGRPGRAVAGFLLVAAGFTGVNLLTFGGTYLLLAGGFAGVIELLRRERPRSLAATVVALLLFGLTALVLRRLCGYDHVLALRTAADFENPGGFLGRVDPAAYFLTRIENVAEIAFFLSFGALAALVRSNAGRAALQNLRDRGTGFLLAGAAALLLLFLAGAYRTGETARTCLFFYPYLLLLFRNSGERGLRDAILLAGFQTGAMQLFTGYFW